MPKLLADRNITWLNEIAGPSFTISYFDDDHSLLKQLPESDALFIRTVTKINSITFPHFPPSLKVIGSASAGFDHVDTEWLEHNNIHFVHSPGCNARSVAEYVISCIITQFDDFFKCLSEINVGIVGLGSTGGEVARLLDRLGVKWIASDPPLENRSKTFLSSDLDEILNCDIVSLHVPLTDSGEHRTRHLINADNLKGRNIALFINAARGGVADEKALIKAKQNDFVKKIVTDVWHNEPDINQELLQNSDIATPHIAGYSAQAKYKAAEIICKKTALLLGLDLNAQIVTQQHQTIDASAGLSEVIKTIHPLFKLNELLRQNPEKFSALRNTHALRQEFSTFTLSETPENTVRFARALRFKST